MSTTYEISELFKAYVDDADTTFMSAGDAVSFLNFGYREFVSIVAEMDSNIYTKTEEYIGVNAKVLNLATTVLGDKVLGANPDTFRMYRLMRVSKSDGSGNVKYYVEPSRSLVSLRNGVNLYMLRGTELLFSEEIDNVLIDYVGFDDEPFTTGNTANSGAGVFIDDLTQFHDLISLLACKHYQIKDFSANPVLMKQLEERKRAMSDFLITGRSFGAQNMVVGSDETTFF